MKKFFNSKYLFALLFGASIFTWSACDTIVDPANPDTKNSLGWFGVGGTDGDNLSNIENDISLGSGSVPSSVDLSANMPAIGNQGQYGTCVTWAIGYGHKSYMDKVSGGNGTTFSAKYLFWAIPTSKKGADCNGTGFEAAYDIMLNKGVAIESDVPYTDMGNCTGSTSSWDGGASKYKIENYREIGKDVASLKKYLAQNRVITFGAKLGDEFMNANSSDVLTTQSYGYTGRDAYHAMVLVGYDDSKGANGAFRIQNSWGNSWGDNGFIWVDENFFSSDDFCFCAFVATNTQSTAPVDNTDNTVDNNDISSGSDVMAWALTDDFDPAGDQQVDRTCTYDVYNSGTDVLNASSKWNILYLYYNTTNADDYGIIIYDYYTNEYGVEGAYHQGADGNNDVLTTGGKGDFNWWNNVNVPSGSSVADATYNSSNSGGFKWNYTMPSISGDYYLVIIADGFDVIKEADETNNYYYLTDSNGGGLTFSNGVMQETPAKCLTKGFNPSNTSATPVKTARTKYNKNTYTPAEIQAMIQHEKETGALQAKVNAYLKSGKKATKVRANN